MGEEVCHGNTQEVLSEYRNEAVQLVRSGDQPTSQVARELSISANVLTRWCRKAKAGRQRVFPGTGKPRDEEMANLRRDLVRVKKERDFLREAAASFASVSK